MPASNPITPKGGRNHIAVDYVSPQTLSSGTGDIIVRDRQSGGNEYAKFKGSTLQFLLDKLGPLGNTGLSLFGTNVVYTAAGTTQGTATPIAAPFAVVVGADGTKGVILPTYQNGAFVLVVNQVTSGGSPLLVYPPSGWTMNLIPVNSAISIPAGKSALLVVFNASQYAFIISA